MEKILGQSPAAKCQDKNLNLNSDMYGAAEVSSVKNEASELNKEERSKKNLILGDTQVSENCDSLLFFKESSEKATTLLESAFKVMKTLFSPEKTKNKTSNPVNQHKSVLESSSNSFNLPNKEKLIISELEFETPVMNSPLPEENVLKDKKQLSMPMLSSLSLDFQSNDDDSFLTTVSYDESFKSAVTHFDENGEVTKTCDSLSHGVFNNSQDLDVAGSCNSSLENSECFLENTMLKNENTSSKEISHNGFSIKTINETNEVFSVVKNFDHNNVEVTNPDCFIQASGIQIEIFKADELDSNTQTNNRVIRKISDLNDESSVVNGVSKELDFHELEINSSGTPLKKKNLISDQITRQGLQQLVTKPHLMHCLPSNDECIKSAQKNKIIYTENINWDFAEMGNIETEKSVLQNKCESFTPHVTKSDLNEMDEMLFALKYDSGTGAPINSINENYAVFNGTGDACDLKRSDLTRKDEKTEESTKCEKSVSPDKILSDKAKEFLQKRITDEIVDNNNTFMETQPSSVSSLKKETEKIIESQKPDQNQLNLVSLSNLNNTNGNNNEGLDFDRNDNLASIPEENCTILCPDERSADSPDSVLVNNSHYAPLLTATNPEFQKSENEDDSETASLLVGETDSMFSLKHSTPVSNLRSSSSVCSINEKSNMNSLEISKESDGKINCELHSARSDFLSKAMGIFFEQSNPSISAESISPGSLKVSSKPTELIRSPVIKSELNKSEKLTQNLKERSKSPSSNRLNFAYEINHSRGQGEVFKENLEFFECDHSLDEKSNSIEIEKSDPNKTGEVREPVKLNRNKNFEYSKIANRTYDKVPDSGELNTLNLTFSKKVDTKFERNKSLPLNELNCAHDKESNKGKNSGCEVNDINKILEKSLGFISDKERSELSESEEADCFLSPIKEPPALMSQAVSVSSNESLLENIDDNNKDCIYVNEENHSFFSGSFSLSPSSGNSSLLKTQIAASNNHVMENLAVKLKEIHLTNEPNKVFVQVQDEPKVADYETVLPAELNKNIEADVAQLIEEQFTPNDIAKICDIATLSESLNNENLKAMEGETEIKVENVLSPKSFDFLNSIQGKPTGRDLSRESLYVKFDPLVQPSTANSLIDFTKEVEAITASEACSASNSSSICEELLAISPEKKSNVIVPPLTPLSDRNKKDKVERQKELQNEIYFLKNLYSERERLNKAKMEEYESQIAKLTGDKCVFDDKLKECAEREKSLVKKITSQTRDIEQLKVVMKEYVKVISVLSTELETIRKESAKEIECLNAEKESYMNHLLNTEAAFSDVHTKYEKSKRTIESLKLNEILYRNTISEHAQKMEEYKKKAKEVQEKAMSEFQHIMAELQESKNIHSQEVSRLRAQLKKTELKLEALQESLDQKIKENQQLTAICDELIEGKK